MRKLLIALLLPFRLFAQDPQLEKYIDSLVGSFNNRNAPGSMILVTLDGKPLVKKAYGMANLELNVPLRVDHAFAIGSVTKQFTAIAILQLVQAGKLSLSDDIRKYLPFFDTHGQTITIENLLTHTSGIVRNLSELRMQMVVDAHPDQFLRYVMKLPIDFEPGTDWNYSNIGFRILSIIVERVSRQNFAAYAKEHLFEPAGMHNSYVADDLQFMDNLVSSYISRFNGKWRNASTLRPEWNWAKGAGNIISTLDDMYRWHTALLAGKIVSNELLERAFTAYQLKNGTRTYYGYGFNIMAHQNFRLIHHNGGIYGYRNVVVFVPEKKLYLQYANLYSGDISFISKKILERLLQITPPTADEKYTSNLSDYAGDYEQHYAEAAVTTRSKIPVYSTVFVKNDSLYFQEKFGVPVLLLPSGKDRFMRRRAEDGFYEFSRDKNNRVVSIRFRPFLYAVGNSGVENKRINAVHPTIPKPITVNTTTLKKYTGTYYRPQNAAYLFVELQGEKLFASGFGNAKYELIPLAENKFIRKGLEDFSFTFSEDENGIMKATGSGFTQYDYKKIAD